jgi:hypothetical protein
MPIENTQKAMSDPTVSKKTTINFSPIVDFTFICSVMCVTLVVMVQGLLVARGFIDTFISRRGYAFMEL